MQETGRSRNELDGEQSRATQVSLALLRHVPSQTASKFCKRFVQTTSWFSQFDGVSFGGERTYVIQVLAPPRPPSSPIYVGFVLIQSSSMIHKLLQTAIKRLFTEHHGNQDSRQTPSPVGVNTG